MSDPPPSFGTPPADEPLPGRPRDATSARRRGSGGMRLASAPLAAACASIGAFFALLCLWKPEPVADEVFHLTAVREIVAGRWPAPGYLSMLPSYHLAASVPARWLGASLTLLRTFNLGLALLALLLIDRVARRLDAPPASVLLVAWNPLLFPFWTLAYTESAVLLTLAAGVYFHLRRWRLAAVTALLAACFVRQSSLIWLLFVAAWDAADAISSDASRRRDGTRLVAVVLRETWPHMLAAAGFLGFIHSQGGFSLGAWQFASGMPNVAQYYLFALAIAVVWAPAWMAHVAGPHGLEWRRSLRNPLVLAALLGAVGILEMSYANPHGWNGDPGYLRNRLLILMSESMLARYLVAAIIAAALPIAVSWTLRQPRRAMLAATSAVALVYLAPHSLVDPRYYAAPMLFLTWFSRLTPSVLHMLTIWNGAWSAVLTGYVLVHGSRLGGVL